MRTDYQLKVTNPYGPNTTVLLPGDCNAHCDFCFWDREGATIKADHEFSQKAIAELMRLPRKFDCLSVSGGEPTLSPEFVRFSLALIQNREALGLSRTVLTTHGGNLRRHLDLVVTAYNHVNISRHAVGYEANCEIFKTTKIPTDPELKQLIADIKRFSWGRVDVTLNCVIRPDTGAKFCRAFIKYAKELGAAAVSFRKEASDALPGRAERRFRDLYDVISETKCPVCRGAVMDVDGFQVRWKGSVAEPSIDTGGVYEAVLHPDAKIYTDWGRKVPFPFPPAKKKAATDFDPLTLHDEVMLQGGSVKLVRDLQVGDKVAGVHRRAPKKEQRIVKITSSSSCGSSGLGNSGGCGSGLSGGGGCGGGGGGCGSGGCGSFRW